MTNHHDPRFSTVDLGGQTFEALDFDHEAVVRRITDEMRAGVAVYYDRRWKLTDVFCRFLLDRRELLRGRTVLAVGAGAGLESVVIGRIADRVIINDLAPASLELAAEQLERNGVEGFEVRLGLLQESDLSGVDLVIGCFVVYNEATRDAMAELLERAASLDVPVILANENVGSFFREVLEGARRPVEDLAALDRGRFVRIA
jgi:predicted nicotinamide N-methyase